MTKQSQERKKVGEIASSGFCPPRNDTKPQLAARVYKLLSYVFLNQLTLPDLKIICKWCDDALAHESELPENISLNLKLIKDALVEITSEDQLLPLKEDYVKLIRSPSKENSPPPPYESVYREGSLWGSSTVEVLKKYRIHDLEPKGKFQREPPDHIGIELEFMASLCKKEKEAVDKEEKEKLRKSLFEFLDNHLIKWFELYNKSALDFSPHSFYKGIIQLTSEWINLHLEHLKTILPLAKAKKN